MQASSSGCYNRNSQGLLEREKGALGSRGQGRRVLGGHLCNALKLGGGWGTRVPQDAKKQETHAS